MWTPLGSAIGCRLARARVPLSIPLSPHIHRQHIEPWVVSQKRVSLVSGCIVCSLSLTYVVRVLHLVRPFMAILPEIATPDRKVLVCLKLRFSG